jgi:hypothetical protein
MGTFKPFYFEIPQVWELSINLPPGEHQFKFLVNGNWRLCSMYQKVDDGVGTDGNKYSNVLLMCC